MMVNSINLDYLMNVEIRNYFKKNALDSEDTMIFSIARNSEDAESHPALQNYGTTENYSGVSAAAVAYFVMAYVISSTVIIGLFCKDFFIFRPPSIWPYCHVFGICFVDHYSDYRFIKLKLI
jgi:hypothetical protein